MIRKAFPIVLILAALTSGGQISAPPRIAVQDEGAAQGTARTVNCTGAGVTCSVTSGVWTLNATGGGGGGNFLEVSIDLGTSMGLVYTVTVTGQSWVTSTSRIVCGANATAADGQTIETYMAAGFVTVVSNLVASTGFDLTIYSPHGATGIFRFACTGG